MKRIILIGLSGSGKSAVACELAARLGFTAIDVDDEIIRRSGMPIPAIFERFGEDVFRTFERGCLASACSQDKCVIATGGGAVLDERNWLVMRPESLIVHILADSNQLLSRLSSQSESDPDALRPLLQASDPKHSLDKMWRERAPFYRQADVSVDTSNKSLDTVAAEILSAITRVESGSVRLPIGTIGTPNGRSDLYVGPGVLNSIGQLARQRFPQSRRAWVISDSNVGPLWATLVSTALAASEFAVERIDVPAGESSKAFDRVSGLLDRLMDGKVDRRDVVVALGGGVIGDLAGFAAAIALRGVGLIQVPTSLLAMVDSSVGGKTGVNHKRGKNLIGAFYQPQLVVADPKVLETLPEREVRGGWAEIIKHAMIESTATGHAGTPLLDLLEQTPFESWVQPEFVADVVRRNVLIKRSVVQADEKETGLRRVLNYGHTLGHAMEASGYRYHHGEAIALGMRAAADISVRIGRSTEGVAKRQNRLLEKVGLPSRFVGDLDDVIERLSSDKKAVNGQLTWILLTREAGSVEVTSDVPIDEVTAAAASLGAQRRN
ncbi:MAG: 3-dehydroquinate synthase [Nitrolancea sp.]